MRKRMFHAILVTSIVTAISFTNIYAAQTFDFDAMTTEELKGVISEIEEVIKEQHTPNSDEKTKMESVTKSYVESIYGSDNVSWAWVDYTYDRDWGLCQFRTHADIKKEDGGKAQYNIYSEVYAENDVYQVVYLSVGTEELINSRSEVIKDGRVLKMLGIESSGEVKNEEISVETEETKTETEAPAAEEPVIAKVGDRSEDARTIQQMLVRMGYLTGAPDGAFGAKTEEAVKAFQAASNLNVDGIVTKSVFDAMKNISDSMPEPEEVFSFSARELYGLFDNNAVAAEAQYKGKTVQVKGAIETIDKTVWGTPYVSLRADDYGWETIQCFFSSSDTNQLVNLSSGQTVTIQGKCGTMSLLSVEVEDCKIIG